MQTKELLILAGRTLYGERWQTELARGLGLTDGRRVRQWLSGDRPIPEGIWKELEAQLKQHREKVDDALKAMSEHTSNKI